ncbi:MAG: hypothetical protein JSW00_08690 [Thermoplasmata archaeon]|nr:MAG: hypothetical protein JSW00_08690 [Thermoplasmata archaeon]
MKNMQKNILAISLVCALFIAISLTGCLDDNGGGKREEESDKITPPDYKIGDTWTAKNTPEEGEPFTMTLTVTSESYLYEGETVMILSVEYFMEEYVEENSGLTFNDTTGSGTAYAEKTYSEIIYMEIDMTTQIKYQGSDEWHDVEMEQKSTFQHEGNEPSKPSIGDTWTITETEDYEYTVWMDGQKISNESDSKTKTKNYEVLGKKNVTVEAGKFDCFEIRFDIVEEDSYTIEYYSPDAKIDVKTVEYEDSNIINIIELISYDVS